MTRPTSKRGRCKHEHWTHHHTTHLAGGVFGRVMPPHKICRCGHYLSLGPASMTDEAKVELDAARPAEMHHEGRRIPHAKNGAGTRVGCAGCGWNAEHRSMPFLDGKPNTDAGYLARQIATHDEEGK